MKLYYLEPLGSLCMNAILIDMTGCDSWTNTHYLCMCVYLQTELLKHINYKTFLMHTACCRGMY